MSDELAFLGEDDELMGELEDILGEDELGLDEILGAVKRRARGGSLAKKVALARAAGGVVTRKRLPSGGKEQPLPFLNTPVTVSAGGTSNLTAQPQRLFKPTRLIIPSAQAQSLLVNFLNVGADPQFVAPGAISAQFFSEVGVALKLKGTTANLGTIIALNVTNPTGVDVTQFAPALLGESVY